MRSITHLAVAALAAATLVASEGPAVPAKPDDRTILHVLNRTGFGARPGDVERVREEGLARYIDRQLHPEKIEDGDIDRRLAPLDALRKSPRELAAEYFEPAMEARRAAQKAAPADGMMTEERPAPTPEQTAAARKSREVLIQLSDQKILRAAFSERQL